MEIATLQHSTSFEALSVCYHFKISPQNKTLWRKRAKDALYSSRQLTVKVTGKVQRGDCFYSSLLGDSLANSSHIHIYVQFLLHLIIEKTSWQYAFYFCWPEQYSLLHSICFLVSKWVRLAFKCQIELGIRQMILAVLANSRPFSESVQVEAVFVPWNANERALPWYQIVTGTCVYVHLTISQVGSKGERDSGQMSVMNSM